jgi:hypothetical protein
MEVIMERTERVWVGSAAMPGPLHYRRRINRQDQTFFFRQGKYIFGALSDGCSASRISEVGAGGFVHAACQIFYKAIKGNLPFDAIPGYFADEIHEFMQRQIEAYPFGKQFLQELKLYFHHENKNNIQYGMENYLQYQAIEEMFQATLLAICIHEDKGGLILIRGDGKVYIDGELTSFDYDDAPPYLIYDFSFDAYEGEHNDLTFKTVKVHHDFKQVAFTSDGWPWDNKNAFPFGRWKYSAFQLWLQDINNLRAEKELKEYSESEKKLMQISEQDGWGSYQPEEINNLARKLVKKPFYTNDKGEDKQITDDISAIVIEKEVIKDECSESW